MDLSASLCRCDAAVQANRRDRLYWTLFISRQIQSAAVLFGDGRPAALADQWVCQQLQSLKESFLSPLVGSSPNLDIVWSLENMLVLRIEPWRRLIPVRILRQERRPSAPGGSLLVVEAINPTHQQIRLFSLSFRSEHGLLVASPVDVLVTAGSSVVLGLEVAGAGIELARAEYEVMGPEPDACRPPDCVAEVETINCSSSPYMKFKTGPELPVGHSIIQPVPPRPRHHQQWQA